MRMPRLAVFGLAFSCVSFVAVLPGSAAAVTSGATDEGEGAQMISAPVNISPQNPPPRDRRPPRRTGTGVIRGRVVDGVTALALVHARVSLSGPSGNVSVTTDASGTFLFGDLAAGRYRLSVIKPGYLTGFFPQGTRSLRGDSGLPVADGQTVENVTVAIYHGGAVVGRLVDAYGDPAEGVTIQAVRAPGSRTTHQPYSVSNANDVGEFRIGRLDPGAYLLVATPHAGGRGESPDDQMAAQVATYYPGVLTPDQAQPVVIERGQVLNGIEFQLVEQAVTTVAGVVLDGSGQPATAGNVSAQSWVGGVGTDSSSPIRHDGTFDLKLPPGEYRLHARVFREQNTPAAIPGGAARAGAVRMGTPENRRQMGMLRLTVGAAPLANVVINTGDGGSITGRIVFDGEGPPVDPARITLTTQSVHSLAPYSITDNNTDQCWSPSMGTVNADLTFTIAGVRGACVIGLSVADSGRWRASSAMYRGADLLDVPVEVDNNQHVRDLRIVVSMRSTRLSADVTDDRGAPIYDYVLIAFSTQKARWPLQRGVGYTAQLPPAASRTGTTSTAAGNLTAAAQLDTVPSVDPMTGSLTQVGAAVLRGGSLISPAPGISSLPPGDYYVVAVDDAGYDDLHDPAFLEQLVPGATRVTLRDGEPQTVPLHRIKAPAAQP
jgi:hypothetical protein